MKKHLLKTAVLIFDIIMIEEMAMHMVGG